jgi:ubiquinone/menaquinone biosynthesis C-methylase UbiE
VWRSIGTEGSEVASFFGARADRYERAYRSRDSGGHVLRARMKASLELLGEVPGEVLDVGMGPGRLAAALATRGWTVSGVDPSSEMVALARSRVPNAAAMTEGTVESLPFAAVSFDAVVATGVLEYVHDRPRAFAEIARVLRPGGLAVLSAPNPLAAYARSRRRIDGPLARAFRRPSPPPGAEPLRRTELERLLADAGLRVERAAHAGFLVVPAPLDRLVPGLATGVAERLERPHSRLGPALATQLVVAARRSGARPARA